MVQKYIKPLSIRFQLFFAETAMLLSSGMELTVVVVVHVAAVVVVVVDWQVMVVVVINGVVPAVTTADVVLATTYSPVAALESA